MIPKNNGGTIKISMEAQPSLTYALDLSNQTIIGSCDGLEAVKQAAWKALYTNRFAHIIYSWNYGAELSDLFGQAIPYVYPELKRKISEALLQDDRILEVNDFSFRKNRGNVEAEFTIKSTEGSFIMKKEVRI